MALSRIWSAFILIAIVVATAKMLFFNSGKEVYSHMVVGKQGDTAYTKTIDSTSLSTTILAKIAQQKEYKSGDTVYTKTTQGKYVSYFSQSAVLLQPVKALLKSVWVLSASWLCLWVL
jgi:hypothetical protein